MEKSNRNLFKPSSLLPMLLQLHKSTTATEMYSMKNYIIDGANNIKSLQSSLMKSISEQIEEFPSDTQEIHEHYEEEYHQYGDLYPSIFNNSTLLSLYSFFEFNLKSLCGTLNSFNKYKLSVDDLAGWNYIDKSKKYLELVAQVEVDKLDKEWKQIQYYQKIRNCIVHNNSSIIKKKNKTLKQQPLYQYVNESPYLKLDSKNATFIIEDQTFLLEFCDLIEAYIMNLIKEINQ